MVNLNGTSSMVNQFKAYEQQRTELKKTRENEKASDDQIKVSANKTDNAISKLSEGAQAVLDRLKEKYNNSDIFVADFSNDEEAQQIMSRGTKEYSILITPDELEKMAADEAYEKDRNELIDNAFAMADKIKDEYSVDKALNEDGDSTIVNRIGISIGNDGSVKIFADLEELNAKEKERIQAARDKRAEDKKVEDKKAEEKAEEKRLEKSKESMYDFENLLSKTKKATVEASSIEELMDKIKGYDWSAVKDSFDYNQVSKFDFKA